MGLKEQKEQLRSLAREKENLEILAQTYDNKWVAHAIRTRNAKRHAKTSYELVKTHAKEGYDPNLGTIEYLEAILNFDLLVFHIPSSPNHL